MRFLILAAAGAAIALPATAASAQNGYGNGNGYGNNNSVRQIEWQCQRALRNADSRREYYMIQRDCQRRIAWAQRASYNRSDNRYDRDRDRYRDRDNDNRYWDGYRWRYR
jgi:hypothetical protein